MKKKFKTYRKINEYGISRECGKSVLRYDTKIYSARREKELMNYLKEKGIL